MSKIAIIGSGLIGQGWATVFAQSGFDVAIYDQSATAAEAALASMPARIKDLVDHDLIAPQTAPDILARMHVAKSLKSALDGAIYVQESGPERLDVKQSLTAEIDALAAPDVPIGSSTSGIRASLYCEHIKGRHRCLVVHPINPPHLIPAVEIVPAPWTGEQVIGAVRDVMTRARRETIVLTQEIDGFVVNRLQGALLEEAFKLIGDGIVSAADLDKAISDGLGLRWSFMGPMRTIHLNAPEGVAQYVERYGPMYRDFQIGPYDDVNWAQIAEEKLGAELAAMIPVADIPRAQADRDRKLMALLRHKANAKSDP